MAAGMEYNPGKMKRSTRHVRPSVWHQDYEMVHPHSSATNVQGQSQGGVNPEAMLPHGNTDVKALSEEVKQMKGMLMNLGEMMKNMQDQSKCSSFISESQSSHATSPGRQAGERDLPVDFRTSFVQELGECLRHHQETSQSLPLPSPPRFSRQSMLPPPSASMLPTPSARACREPSDTHRSPNVHEHHEPPVPCQRNLTSQAPLNVNPIPQYLNQPPGANQDLFRIYNDFGNLGMYQSDPQSARGDPLPQMNQMPGNPFYFQGPPWVPPPMPAYPAYFQNCGFFRPPYFPYPVPNLSYPPLVHPEHVAPIAPALQPPQALPGPAPASQTRGTAPANNPVDMPVRSPLHLPPAPALADPGRPLQGYVVTLEISSAILLLI